ncbi:hypothetical protein [Massilia sp. CF038]|uniref:hypothetical protein n=1 Tax=Massilia sp. CF038 TaxID=1881045 RepID=UPI000914B16E|nr:hypothetical protein [Massilia sp. CF038]SHH19608.1 hypothetical protein SAMN05428948_3261 [Massilia sp. CF038]
MFSRRTHVVAAIPAINRRVIRRLLLAFVLLWSQHAAFAHAVTHFSPVQRTATKALLQDLGCADCLAHAQFSSALASPSRELAATNPVPLAVLTPATQTRCLSTVCVFQSRAPPQY